MFSRPLYDSQHTNNPGTPTPPVGFVPRVWLFDVVDRVTAVIAEGKRPVPFRTRKLSSPAPMVLHPRGCGRVGHRRTSLHSRAAPHGVALPAFHGPSAAERARFSQERCCMEDYSGALGFHGRTPK